MRVKSFYHLIVLSGGYLLLSYSSFIFAAQTCTASIPATTPTEAFTVNNDGTVTHTKTGLVWKVCSEGQTWVSGDNSCSGAASSVTWQAALQMVQNMNSGGGYAGHVDWRLPNLKELASIAELQCYNPAINATIFNNTPPLSYWTSSPYVNISNESSARIVRFLDGDDGFFSRNRSYNVRFVRGGN